MDRLDATTALFGFTSGGTRAMSLGAAKEGGQAVLVATMAFMQVVTILLAAP